MKEIRIIIVGNDNQTHPYEFKSYEEAIVFLQLRVRITDVAEDKLEILDEDVVGDNQVKDEENFLEN